MVNRFIYLAAVAIAALGAGACDSGSPADAAPRGALPSTESGNAAQHAAAGTVNSIDRAAGTVNISHGPVPTAEWPAMTMSFKLANPDAAAGIEPGERVDFKFTIESGMSATVTEMSPAD